MSREDKKQIEEMTETLCNIECKGMKCNVCDHYGCEYRMLAEALYTAGYRKATDVAEEIFGEIDTLIVRRMIPEIAWIDDRFITDFAELKKKYIGSDTNVLTNTECDGNCQECDKAIWEIPTSFVGDSRIIGCKRIKESEDGEGA